MGTIYQAINKINGKSYIGQTKSNSIESRKKSHKDKARSGSDYVFHKAIRKYGFDNFTWIVLEFNCEISDLNKLEKYYIEQYNTYASDKNSNGYNLTRGGDNNFGSSGKYHYLNKMNKAKKKRWLKKHRNGKNNPNFNNGDKIKGDKHFLKKLPPAEREKWLNENLRGIENYQSNMSKDELKEKSWWNRKSKKEIEKILNEKYRGENCPFLKKYKKDPEKYRKIWKEAGLKRRGIPVMSRRKEYILTLPNNEELLFKGLNSIIEYVKNDFNISLSKSNLCSCAKNKKSDCKGFKCRLFDHNIDKNIKQPNI